MCNSLYLLQTGRLFSDVLYVQFLSQEVFFDFSAHVHSQYLDLPSPNKGDVLYVHFESQDQVLSLCTCAQNSLTITGKTKHLKFSYQKLNVYFPDI